MITKEEAKNLYAPQFWSNWSEEIKNKTIDFCNGVLDKTIRNLAKEGNNRLWIPFFKCAMDKNSTFPEDWRYDYCSIGTNCKIHKYESRINYIPCYIHLPTLKTYVEKHGFKVEESKAFIGDAGTTYTIYWI